MAKKATITPVTDTVNNASAINTQLNAINNKLDNTLSLDGSVPNAMGADLDMNSNDILNAGNIQAADISIAGSTISGVLATADASAAAALVSENNASLSATQAAQYDGIWLDDVATLLADTTLTYTAGQPSTVVVGDYVRTRKEGFAYQVAASGDVTTVGGIQLDVMASDNGYNVKAFGAVGGGVDDTVAIHKALDKIGKVVFPKDTYAFSEKINIAHDLNIDFCGSTCTPPAGATSARFFKIISGPRRVKFSNGTLDGQNKSTAYSHLVDINASTCDFVSEGMSYINNVLGGVGTPTISQDTDLVYINTANSAYINNCVFSAVSRQGISFTNACPTVTITNSLFEDCYLFGVDMEPNTSVAGMYKNVTIDSNIFRNNGSKSASDTGWPPSFGNGAMRLQSNVTTLAVFENIHITNNSFISTDFLNIIGGVQPPQIGVEQYSSLVFTGNNIKNIGTVNLGYFSDPTCPVYSTVISGNTVDSSVGNHRSGFNARRSARLVFTGNEVEVLGCAASEGFVVDGNVFKTTATHAVTPQTGTANGVISNNVFDVATAAVSTSSTSTGYTLIGNETNGKPITGPAVNLPTVRVGNSDNVVTASSRFEGDLTQFTIPTATPTTVFDLTNTGMSGMIVVTEGGSKIGSYAMFGNFTDGVNNSSFLTNVQNSGVSGSALTLSGNLIQFAHTFGSSRYPTVNVINFGKI
jgi:hypothetical protein